MFQSFLIKYAEIGLKGKNRYVFEDALMKHIRRSLKELEGTFAVTKESGRIYVEAKSEFDYDEVVDAESVRHRRNLPCDARGGSGL